MNSKPYDTSSEPLFESVDKIKALNNVVELQDRHGNPIEDSKEIFPAHIRERFPRKYLYYLLVVILIVAVLYYLKHKYAQRINLH
jgi:hypothetical protein